MHAAILSGFSNFRGPGLPPFALKLYSCQYSPFPPSPSNWRLIQQSIRSHLEFACGHHILQPIPVPSPSSGNPSSARLRVPDPSQNVSQISDGYCHLIWECEQCKEWMNGASKSSPGLTGSLPSSQQQEQGSRLSSGHSERGNSLWEEGTLCPLASYQIVAQSLCSCSSLLPDSSSFPSLSSFYLLFIH